MIKIKNIKKHIFLYFTFGFLFIFTPLHSSSVLEIKEDDIILGDINAPITIIEYASLSCIHCAKFHKNTLPKIVENYIDTGKAKMVFRHFPLKRRHPTFKSRHLTLYLCLPRPRLIDPRPPVTAMGEPHFPSAPALRTGVI